MMMKSSQRYSGKTFEKAPAEIVFITDPAITVGLTAPTKIAFDASKLPINPLQYQILSYEWDFGDGYGTTNQRPTHSYDDDGIYSVNLTITDE